MQQQFVSDCYFLFSANFHWYRSSQPREHLFGKSHGDEEKPMPPIAHSVTVASWLVQQNAFQIKHELVKWPKIPPALPHFSDLAEWELTSFPGFSLPSRPPLGDRLKKTGSEEQKSAWEEEASHHFVMWSGRSKDAAKDNMFGNIWKIWRAAVNAIHCPVFIEIWNSSKTWQHDSILSKGRVGLSNLIWPSFKFRCLTIGCSVPSAMNEINWGWKGVEFRSEVKYQKVRVYRKFSRSPQQKCAQDYVWLRMFILGGSTSQF